MTRSSGDSESGIEISGAGHCLPSVIEDNHSLCENLSVDPDWILEKTGIKRRYLLGEGESSSSLALSACQKAIKNSGVLVSEIDLIVVCTFSGDYVFPPLSSKLSGMLGLNSPQVFDLQANCTGFVVGLTVASDRLKSDLTMRNALVVGVEVNSPYIDRSNVDTAVYMSDGAGAVVLSRCDPKFGICGSAFSSDSSNYEAVRLRFGGSRYRELDEEASMFMEMNGIATWKQAIINLPPVIRKACRNSGVELEQVDSIIFHQSNWNMIEYVTKKLGLNLDQTYSNVKEIGNTGAASVAIALSEAIHKKFIKRDQILVLAAIGAGFNFGASIWRWRN